MILEGLSNQNNSMICRGTEPRWLIRGVSAVQMCLLPPTSCACTTTDAPLCSPTLCQNPFPPQAPAANVEGWGMLWEPAELCWVMSERGGTQAFWKPPLCCACCCCPVSAWNCGSTKLSSAEPARRGTGAARWEECGTEAERRGWQEGGTGLSKEPIPPRGSLPVPASSWDASAAQTTAGRC